jgi:hypothetical protein
LAFRHWTIESWDTYDYCDSHEGGAIRHVHAIDRLVARKPSPG